LKLLLVEDQRQDAELTCAALTRAGYSFAVTRVETEAEYSAALEGHPDIVLCDHVLPEFDSVRALQLLKARGLDIPFIMLSGEMGEDFAVDAMRRGADDYLLKDRLTRLGPAIASALERRDMRREAQRAAAEHNASEERFRATFEQAAVGIVHTSLDSKFLLVNATFSEMIGYTRDELLQSGGIRDVLHPDEHGLGVGTRRLLEGVAQTYARERRFVRKDGTVIWLNGTVSLVRDAAGIPLYYVRVLEDVTERKRAQQRATLLQESTLAISNAHDLEAAMSSVLHEICRCTGWTYGRAWQRAHRGGGIEVRTTWHADTPGVTAFHQQSPSRWADLSSGIVGPVFSAREPHWLEDIRQAQFQRRDIAIAAGFTSWAGIPVLGQHEAVAVFEFFIKGNQKHDRELVDLVFVVAGQLGKLFQQKAVQEALRKSEEKFRQLAENIPQVFWMADPDQSSITFLSSGFEALTGRREPQCGKNVALLLSVVHEDDRERVEREWKLKGALGAYDIEYRIIHADGSERWVHDRAFPVWNAQGAVERIAGITEDITERKHAQEQLLHLAHFDRLTDLPNRVLVYDRFTQALAQARRNAWSSAILFIGLDRFKNVNDTLGHAQGDKLLQMVAGRMRPFVHSGDTVGRVAGDEFAVILSELAAPQDAGVTVQNILNVIAEPFDVDGHEVYVTASVGIAVYPTDGEDADTLIRNADKAMHVAKAAGRNGYRYYTAEMNERVLEKRQLEIQLRRALDREEFLLHYQPKVDIATGDIAGVEALLRWQPTEGGLVSPDRFIPLLEETGLIVPVGEWVLRKACAQLKSWKDTRVRLVPIAVNLSTRQFHQQDLCAIVARTLREHGISARLLELEITESAAMQDAEASIAMLRDLRALGVRLSIDDFGTGYSSLSYLKRLPVDTVKIDRAFVKDLATNADDASIAQAIIKMSHTLGLKVVAEGVETSSQLAFLSSHGCDQMQGYYFSRPVPAAEVTEMLCENRRLERPPSDPRSGERTLLLLDDEDNVLSSLKRLLRRDSYEIFTATNAQAAFEILANHRVGVIVSDQRMPGTTGVEFLRRVKELYPESVRMVLSGYTDLESVTDAINQGAVYRFLTKPWDDSLLRANIAEAFRRYATMRQTEREQQQAATRVAELSHTNGMLQMFIDQRGAGNAESAGADYLRRLEAKT
jgi:diguanylate cyclase (GGDEF)-like protein/PAS domain S-box-containing protein